MQIHHKYTLLPFICLCTCAYMHMQYSFFYFSPMLLSIKCHSDYNTIDGRIAGNRCPYPDIRRSIPLVPSLMHWSNDIS